MNLLLNGKPTDLNLISVNDGLNYGRFFEAKALDYELHLGKTVFIAALEKEYIRIKEEIREDDKNHNDTSDFSASNYCSLNELFVHTEEFKSIFETYLDQVLFRKLFQSTQNTQFVINSTDTILIKGDEVVIKGRCFKQKL